MDNVNNQAPNNQAQPIELDPNIKAILDDVEKKLGQVNMLIVMQFTTNVIINCVAQLPGFSKELVPVVIAPMVSSLNAAIAFSESVKKASMPQQQGEPTEEVPTTMMVPMTPGGAKLN